MVQLELVEQPPPKPMGAQLRRVYDLMCDGRERTLVEIGRDAECLPTSASARFRDVRKLGCDIRKEKIGEGLWAYWMVGG